MLRRFVCWRGVDAWRAEAALVERDAHRLRSRGTQIAAAYRADYELDTDASLLTRSLTVSVDVGEGTRRLRLVRSGDGSWSANEEPLPNVQGALDCTWPSRRSPTSCRSPGSRMGPPTT